MMQRLPRWLLVAFALVLFGQSVAAAAHCLRLAAAPAHGGFLVEICTADGIMVMDLGDPSDQHAPTDHDHAGFCPACHGVPQALLPAPPAIPLPIERPALAGLPMPEAVPPIGARAPPYAPRGPPRLS